MQYDRYKHHRRSNRLKGWDYSRPGVYFVTINVKGRVCYFGEIKNNELMLSKVGKVAHDNLVATPKHFPHVFLDQFVVMPNHVHLILFIERPIESARRGVQLNAPTDNTSVINRPENLKQTEKYYKKITPKPGSLSIVIRTYKASVKTWCNNNGYGDFDWQRGFNDRVIRSNKELKRVRKYIIDNPKNWDEDENNPFGSKRI